MMPRLPMLLVVLGAFEISLLSAPRDVSAQPPAGPAAAPVAVPTDQAPRAGIPGPVVAAPMAPAWIPLSAKHQEYLDQVLAYWEHKSSAVQRYRCEFKRWEYDPVFGPRDVCKTFSEGVIKYSAPDKGLFRVDRLLEYQAPQNAGDKPTWVPPKEQTGGYDHWVCDGRYVFQFDQQKKKLIQNELPPEVRGQAIGKGPLPFLFNAKAEDIKQRFWLHVITPRDVQNEYWLEAVPKTQEDAANFKMVHVIIDQTDFLPKAMVLFDTNYVAGVRPARTTFQFNNREVNFSVLAEQLNLFHREFYEPKLPAGWTRETIQAAAAPAPSDVQTR
ncbi:MAG: TIGR03009 domain-containing protein [Pirellulaceae bacterium]|jgi:TIGR03009 family protein|nr:TIGR03009 domain-containing protein [Pirellulaceae bacterium]